MERFQYRIVNLGLFNAADRMVRTFATLGQDGWELVAMYDKSSNWFANMEKGLAIFKRSVPEGREPDGNWASLEDTATFVPGGDQRLPPDSPYNDPNYGAW